jgi:hypothetical protein
MVRFLAKIECLTARFSLPYRPHLGLLRGAELKPEYRMMRTRNGKTCAHRAFPSDWWLVLSKRGHYVRTI